MGNRNAVVSPRRSRTRGSSFGIVNTDDITDESASESSDMRNSPSDCIQRQKYFFGPSEDGHMAWLASGISASEDSTDDDDIPFTVDFGDDVTSSLRRIETMASVTSHARASPRHSRTSAPSCGAFHDGNSVATGASAAHCSPALLPGFTHSDISFEVGPSTHCLASGLPSARGDEGPGGATSEPSVIARDMSMDLHPVVMARRRSLSFAWGGDSVASPSFVTVSPRLASDGAVTPRANGSLSGMHSATPLLHSPITTPHPRRPALTLPPLRGTTAARAALGAVTPISCPHPLPPLRVASTTSSSSQ